MKKLFILALVALMASITLAANTRKQIEFVDDQDKPRTDITSVTVWDLGTATGSTIYTDIAGNTAITNPMTLTSSRSTIHAAAGNIFFCSEVATHDIEAVIGGVTVKFYAVGGTLTILTVPNTVSTGLVLDIAPDYYIWVSPAGDDSTSSNGSFKNPYLTITKALATATATRNTIMVMPGDYDEVDIIWPNTSGISLKGVFGGVTISQATDAATAVITMAPTRTASWYASISNLTIKSDFSTGTKGKCLNIANVNVTAGNKMGITLNNVNLSTKAVTDFSLVSTGTVAGSIRVYATGNYPTWEGIVTWTSFNTGDRLRVYNHRIIGVPTAAAAIISEVTFINSALPAISPHTNTLISVISCWTESDADPDVYTDYTDRFSE